EQLAVVACLYFSQAFGIGCNEVAEPSQKLAASACGDSPPCRGVKRAMSGFHRALDVCGAALGDQRPGLAGIGIERFEVLATRRLAEFAVDVEIVAFHRHLTGWPSARTSFATRKASTAAGTPP